MYCPVRVAKGKMVNPEDTKRQKARDLRYRRAIVKEVNLDKIKEELMDIQEECYSVQYCFEDDETLLEALDGDTEDAHEFKMMFADLCAECEQMQMDLEQEYVPETFDDFFTAVSREDALFGWDSFENDYMGITGSYEEELARQESRKRMSRLTKEQILESAQLCFHIFRSYIGLRHRYDCLKSAMDILRDENTKYLQIVKQINEVYDRANEDGMLAFKESYSKLDTLVSQMPAMAWLQ